MLTILAWIVGGIAVIALAVGVPLVLAHLLGRADAQSNACPHPARYIRVDKLHPAGDLTTKRTLLNAGDAVCLLCCASVDVQIGHQLGEHFGYSLHGGARAFSMRTTVSTPSPLIPLPANRERA